MLLKGLFVPFPCSPFLAFLTLCSGKLPARAPALFFYWTQSWIILTYKASRKLLLMKKDYDQEASFLPSEVSCWISRLCS